MNPYLTFPDKEIATYTPSASLRPTVDSLDLLWLEAGTRPKRYGPQQVRERFERRSHSRRREANSMSGGGNMMEATGRQEVHRVHSRSARKPDVLGSHSSLILDQIWSSWFLPSLNIINCNGI